MIAAALLAAFIFLLALLVWSSANQKLARSGVPEGRIVAQDVGRRHKVHRPFRSIHCGLVGKPDYLIETRDGPVPVEIKSRNSPRVGPRDGDVAQLTAYCVLVEEVTGTAPPHGIVEYSDRHWRIEYTTVYQSLPASTDAPPAVRDMIDMTDATAEAGMKKAIAIDAAADQLMDASDQLASELGQAAPGTAPMIEAESAAMLVKAHALTQSAMAELFRIRAIDIANTGAALKFNANNASDTRRDLTNMFKK